MNSRQKQQKSITIPKVANTGRLPNSPASTGLTKTPKVAGGGGGGVACKQQANKMIASTTTTNRNIFNKTKQPQTSYFKTTNPTFGGGGNFMTNHMQQMETIPGSRGPSTSSTTPTSLTNLAQLSGITLLPIKSTTNNKQKMIIHKPTTSQNEHNFNSTTTTNNDRKSNPATTKKSTHNLANISSVQLLNQTSLPMPTHNYKQPKVNKTQHQTTTSPRTNIRNNYDPVSNNKQYKQQPKTTNSSRNSSNIRSQGKNKTNYNNDIQVIPKNEPLPSYSDYEYLPRTQNNNVDDILAQPSQEESMTYQSSGVNNYDDDEMNNISLLKLMAILNNPALTITPIDSSFNNSSASRYSTFDNLPSTNINSYESNPLSITALSCGNQIQQPGCSGITISGHKSNSQKQTNLRNVKTEPILSHSPRQSGSLELQIGASNQPKENYNDLSGSHTLEPADIQLNWLNDYLPHNSFNSLSHDTNQSNISHKINDQPTISTSVKNIMMQQLPSTSRKSNTVSVELLKHVSNQAYDIHNDTNEMSIDRIPEKATVQEQDCMVNITRSIQQNPRPGVKISKCCDIVTTECSQDKKRKRKQPMETSRDRLYFPRNELESSRKKVKMIDETCSNFRNIKVTAGEDRQVYLSEQHFILDNMMRDENDNRQKSAIPEPDDIFINRSKRIMSKIDTMIERKKRRRFERISSRAEAKTNSMEDQYEESENEWSDDEDKLTLQSTFIPIQVPLDEMLSSDKREHLLSVGLVSRSERNRLLVEQTEKKVNLISPIIREADNEVSPDVRRFVDTIVQTGGGIDVQLCVNSDIKRTELPLIEGLNRNTSRLKMSFMNTLGLEKRSKRTTLYKVKTNNDISSSNNLTNDTTPQGQADLNRNKNVSERQKVDQLMEMSKSLTSITNKLEANGTTISQVVSKLKLTTCRDAIKLPNKNEYMKSLGLMAS